MNTYERNEQELGMLIILSGLPGSGKSSIGRELAREIRAVFLRIDSIEGALVCVADEGYRVAYSVAEDNLRLRMTVIADAVNPIAITRAAWRAVAERAGVRMRRSIGDVSRSAGGLRGRRLSSASMSRGAAP
jgi:predicted kinase